MHPSPAAPRAGSARSAPSAARPGALVWLALAASGLLALPARADLGDGLKMGPGRLKLGVEASARYDSEAVVAVGGSGGAAVQSPGDGIALARGAFDLSVPGESSRIALTGNLDWNQYLGLASFSFFGANVLGSAQFNPDGPFGVDLKESLNRSDRTDNPLLGVGVLGLNDTTGIRLHTAPGGGAIELGAGYEFGADIFSPQLNYQTTDQLCTSNPSCDPLTAAAFDTLASKVGADARWHIFPKTGFTLEASYGWTTYLFGSTINAQPASPLRVVAGFGTLLNTQFTFAIRAGYEGIFFAPATPMLNDMITQIELGYRVNETFSLRGGYQRSDQPIAGASLYFGDNRGYLELKGEFNRLDVTGNASLDFIGYGGSSTGRTDVAFSSSLSAAYHLNEWLRATATLEVSARGVQGDPLAETNPGYNYGRVVAGAGLATLF